MVRAEACVLQTGDELYFSNSNGVAVGRIESIRVYEEEVPKVEVAEQMEVGIKLDMLPNKNMKVLLRNSDA